MRHKKTGRKLNRSWEHRKAMFRNMAGSLITHERIRTTEARAKELSKVMDKLVTLAVRDDLHSRRLAYKWLNNHQLVKKLFDEIGPRFKTVPGGYTRVVKMGQPRKGDCAPMAVIEFSLQEGETLVPRAERKPEPVAAAAPAAAAVSEEAFETAEASADEAVSEEAVAEEAVEAAGEEAPAEEPAAEAAPEEVTGDEVEDVPPTQAAMDTPPGDAVTEEPDGTPAPEEGPEEKKGD